MNTVPGHTLDPYYKKSVKIESGHKVTLMCRPPTGRGRQNGYWKTGVRLEVYDWLITVCGETCNNIDWSLDKGDWIYTGSQAGSGHTGYTRLWLNFWFRDRRKAMLFKLRWQNEL